MVILNWERKTPSGDTSADISLQTLKRFDLEIKQAQQVMESTGGIITKPKKEKQTERCSCWSTSGT